MKTVARLLTALLLSTFTSVGFAADAVAPVRAADLLPPVRLTAAGSSIVAQGRCAALTMGDVDNDGRLDLLVGQMLQGRLHIYRNIGTAHRFEFAGASEFIAGSETACVPTGCYTAFKSQLVDFDGDGLIDILSPSFDSGIYLFRRTRNGEFAEAEILEDHDGQPFRFRYNGAVLAYDWDADNDLDLLLLGDSAGTRAGISLRINEGNRREPAYGDPQPLTASGKRLLGRPCSIVDWDGDGKDDLLTCAGGVYWYRNKGEPGNPVLVPAEILVPSGRYENIKRRHDEPQRLPDQPGRIDSICVADINGDGQLDLLATSTWSETVELPEPTKQQQAIKALGEARARKLLAMYGELNELPQHERREARVDRQRERLRVWEEYAALRARLSRFQSHRDYGCVWLFERSAAGS